MQNNEETFPIDVGSPAINWLQKLLLVGIKILAIMMAMVIFWGIIDVGFILYDRAVNPPFLFINIEDFLGIFGSFLAVLIAIEIFINIVLYLKKDFIHLKLVISTALMAISRKVIILDYDHLSASHMFGIAAIIASLGVAYWFVYRHAHLLTTSNQSK